MQVTLDEIRRLRKTLHENRIAHEALIAQTRRLRQQCQEVRQQHQQTSYRFEMIQQSIEADLSVV